MPSYTVKQERFGYLLRITYNYCYLETEELLNARHVNILLQLDNVIFISGNYRIKILERAARPA